MEAKSRITAYALCLMALLALCLPALADYHYASHEGSNEYPYTSWETAAELIQDAVDAAVAGDTVFIDAGHWYEYVDLSDSDTIAVIGMGIDVTFCHYDSIHGFIFDYVTNGCLIQDITFADEMYGSCIYGRLNAGYTVNKCRFYNSRHGVAGAGYPVTVVSNCVFDSCENAIAALVWIGNFFISNNLILNSYEGHAITLQLISAVVQNNIIINQQMADVGAIGGAPVSDVVIRNNVAVYGIGGIGVNAYLKYNNIAKDITRDLGWGIGAGDNSTLFNNLLIGCDNGIILVPSREEYFINYNAFWNNDIDIQSWGMDFDSIGNIFCNPMLVLEDDFHLQAHSPLIDAGDPDYLDVDGSRSDIGFHGGPYGESYIYQDLPPVVPDDLSGEFIQDSIIIVWNYNTEADFSHYLLYRDTVSGFEPSVFNFIAETDTSFYIDADVSDEYIYYYRISAVDNQDNVSDYSDELEVITTDIWGQPGAILPQITSIKTSYPNPFNTSTTIGYYVANLGPIPAEIEINIYDITGRKVRILINEWRDIGEHSAVWDGKDDKGNECSTGVYFARISQWGLQISGKPRKLVLIK